MKRSERLGMRVSSADKEAWKKAATAEGLSLSAWIERTLNAAADEGRIFMSGEEFLAYLEN